MHLISKLKYIIAVFTTATLVKSCAKLSDNGILDGKWHLVEMYSKEDGSTYIQNEETYGQGIYWMFQMQLLNIRTRAIPENVYSRDIIARFRHVGNQLQITETYVHFRDRDSLLIDPNTTLLVPIGIRGNKTNYNIKQLNSRRMVLCSELDSLVFVKK